MLRKNPTPAVRIRALRARGASRIDRAKVIATRAECLIVWRRRKGITQGDAALILGVPVDRIRQWETGANVVKVPRSRVGSLRDYETCFLLRRRAGLTQAALAKKIGISRLWLLDMEAGTAPCDRLKAHWAV